MLLIASAAAEIKRSAVAPINSKKIKTLFIMLFLSMTLLSPISVNPSTSTLLSLKGIELSCERALSTSLPCECAG